MTQSDAPAASADVTIDAAPDKVYALITDLPTLASLGDEIAEMEWQKSNAMRPGAVFKATTATARKNGRRRAR